MDSSNGSDNTLQVFTSTSESVKLTVQSAGNCTSMARVMTAANNY